MYRNLNFFRFPEATAEHLRNLAARTIDGTLLDDELGGNALKPVGQLEMSSRGWVPPLGWPAGEGPDSRAGRVPMFRGIGDTIHLTLGGEDKILPAAVLHAEFAKKLEAIEKDQGRRPGGRERKRIKDDLLHEMLPRALVKPSRVCGYLDLRRGLLVVDSASRKVAESFASHVRATLGSFPAMPLNAEVCPRSVLTGWLEGEHVFDDERDYAGLISLGDACRLQDAADGGGVVTFKGEDLQGDEVAKHLEAGKQCTRLGLCMDDHLAFTLGEDMVVRGMKFLDGAMDSLESVDSEELGAEFDARAALLVGEVGRLFDVLERAFKLSKVEG